MCHTCEPGLSQKSIKNERKEEEGGRLYYIYFWFCSYCEMRWVEFISFVEWLSLLVRRLLAPRENQKTHTKSGIKWVNATMIRYCHSLMVFFSLPPPNPFIFHRLLLPLPGLFLPPLERYYFLMKCFCRRRSADAATTASAINQPPLFFLFSFFLINNNKRISLLLHSQRSLSH